MNDLVVGAAITLVSIAFGKEIDRRTAKTQWKRNTDLEEARAERNAAAELDRWQRARDDDRERWFRDKRAEVYGQLIDSSLHIYFASDDPDELASQITRLSALMGSVHTYATNDVAAEAFRLQLAAMAAHRDAANEEYQTAIVDSQDRLIDLCRAELGHSDPLE